MGNRMKIVVAPASFKGSLSNIQAADVMKKAVLASFPDAEIVEFPIADGGEGTINTLKKISGGTLKYTFVHGPLFKRRKAAWLKKGKTAFIEMAQASGLTLLKDGEKDPFKTTTFGTGELLAKAAFSGCREIIMGVGGSATNDAGIGALTALGIKFHTRDGKLIYPGAGEDLEKISGIDKSGMLHEILRCKITVLSDVKNNLFGKEGAAHVYAAQKGADNKKIELLDSGLRNFALNIKQFSGANISSIRGGGAAGGIVAGFAAFFDIKVVSGIEAILEMGMFEKNIQTADLILTGEGKIDKQTYYGKSLGKIFCLAQKHGILTIAAAGNIDPAIYRKAPDKIVLAGILPGTAAVEEAMKKAKTNLYNTTFQMLKIYKSSLCAKQKKRKEKNAGKN